MHTTIRTFAAAAVAAAGALATLGADTAVAGRTVSPFAGQFRGPYPDAFDPTLIWGSISISSNGSILMSEPPYGDDRLTGAVAPDGKFEIYDSWNPNKARWWVRDAGPDTKNLAGTIHFVASAGAMVVGSDGNLYGTTTRGNSFVWVRK